MTRRLSSTIFQGDSSQQVLVEDAYGIANNETRNSMYESVKGVFADSVDGIQSNKSSPRQIANIIQAARRGTADKMDLIDRALGVMGTSLPGLLGTVGGTLKNIIGDAAESVIGPGAKKNIDVLFDGIPTMISVIDVDNTQSLFEFIAELTGNSELARIVNIEAEASIIGALASSVMEYGIPDLMDDIIETSRSEAAQRKAWEYISTDAVYGADLAAINHVIDKIGLTAFLENNPNAIDMILGSFFFGTNDTVDTWPAKRVELITTLARINATWDKYNRNGVLIPNLQPFQVASDDAKKLFQLQEPELTYCLTAVNFPPSTPFDVMSKMYPGALFTD